MSYLHNGAGLHQPVHGCSAILQAFVCALDSEYLHQRLSVCSHHVVPHRVACTQHTRACCMLPQCLNKRGCTRVLVPSPQGISDGCIWK